MKRKSLREKLFDICFNKVHDTICLDKVLRLIRNEQKRKCGECLRIKLAIDKQIAKNKKGDIKIKNHASPYADFSKWDFDK